MTRTMTGGCQCGHIRYTARLESDDAYLCHCRMCQKATGGFAAAFVQVPTTAVAWNREPDWYESSPIARRPFCSRCGSPLGFDFKESSGEMDLTVGSFDEPEYFHPVAHAGCESLHESWLDTKDLPRHYTATTESVASRWKAAGLEVPE
ncbi:GFA family protein [Novosphingobium malaysiense]|uniref:Aldehyde-activating protein n=1 Tax=Novosphingobium malaysiense TaxID=1348853 RepID=A0A0B1ZR91_9SPHN|nr:GFA family protein [Novosphingobium malaysiense]KHK91763.1 aldehyde-activating protein [Novosphingobium malaysiense]